MYSRTIVYATLGLATFAFVTPAAPHASTFGYPYLRDAVPIDLGAPEIQPDDSATHTDAPPDTDTDTLADADILTAHATMPPSPDQEIDAACRAAARASNGGHDGTIIACFHGGQNTSQRIPHTATEDTSTHTGAPTPPDVSGLPGCLGPCITLHFGRVPPPVYYIDLKSIPEAPKGSDAWKISQGLQRQP
ncbi:hypothetical protein MTR62_08445 [Novosphingobium sp. 1949]|uniref:Uncharacterized protein n=1 Tax=Novosphingobium organovorum TaxID=2930092 RepID=A0ABT0BCY5_9SPHN|nr:hypothetical protein [Novosphingobium organovorum]MCJ2182718.1 hypothetical protein [Novosphingobium organovorum]